MGFLPRRFKLIFLVFLGLGLTSWIVWFFSPQIKSGLLPISSVSPEIEVISDVFGFTIKEDKTEIFYKYLQEWGFLAKGKFFLKETKQFVTPQKFIFHLANQEQGEKILDEKQKLALSKIGWVIKETWNEKDKTGDIFLFFGPKFFTKEYVDDKPILYYYLNKIIIYFLYDRSHSSSSPESNYEMAEKFTAVLWRTKNDNKMPFRLELERK